MKYVITGFKLRSRAKKLQNANNDQPTASWVPASPKAQSTSVMFTSSFPLTIAPLKHLAITEAQR